MLGLYVIVAIILVVIVMVLLIIEIAFWVIMIGGLATVSLLLWATGMHEGAIGLAIIVAVIWGAGWGIYKLIKWDLDRLGAPPKVAGSSLYWRIHGSMNIPFSFRSSPKPKIETPPVDPEDRFLWANRLGKYASTDSE